MIDDPVYLLRKEIQSDERKERFLMWLMDFIRAVVFVVGVYACKAAFEISRMRWPSALLLCIGIFIMFFVVIDYIRQHEI